KIEGRLKDQAYVANVVRHYRTRLDSLLPDMGLKAGSSGRVTSDFTPDINKTFNRGYTTAFLHGRGESVGSIDTPKMQGECLGTIVSLDPKGFELDRTVSVSHGDGLCFIRDGELCGALVNGVQGRRILPNRMQGLEKGLVMYRNHDHAFLRQLNKARIHREIPVTLVLSDTPDGFCLSATDEQGHHASVTLSTEKTPARDPEAAAETLRKQFAKTGKTIFVCTDIQVQWEQPSFLPVSVVNGLRRDVLEALLAERARNRPSEPRVLQKNTVPYPDREITFSGNVINQKARAFYERHGARVIEPGAESGLSLQGRTVMTTKYCLKDQLGLCPRSVSENPVVGPPAPRGRASGFVTGKDGEAGDIGVYRRYSRTQSSCKTSRSKPDRILRHAPNQGKDRDYREPLYLRDEQGHLFELAFDCQACQMMIRFTDHRSRITDHI
ncbi:MAG: U32 family peptidase, partial [Phycisphaerae bacterium]|nr:U32 family peptidase [Phycisphaerae bacterium]